VRLYSNSAPRPPILARGGSSGASRFNACAPVNSSVLTVRLPNPGCVRVRCVTHTRSDLGVAIGVRRLVRHSELYAAACRRFSTTQTHGVARCGSVIPPARSRRQLRGSSVLIGRPESARVSFTASARDLANLLSTNWLYGRSAVHPPARAFRHSPLERYAAGQPIQRRRQKPHRLTP